MTTPPRAISKGRKIAAWILVGLISALLLMSAGMKLMASPEVAATFAKYGLDGKMMLIGVGELLTALLFLIPRTSSFGVLVFSGYMGGAIATHMEQGEPYVMPAIMLVVGWFANWLRNPEMFYSFRNR